jgi:hypothetical protein
MMVVDEAHHLEWAPDDPSESYELVASLAEKIPGVLLLTATPEHLGVASHFARLRLLDPARYHDLEQFIAEEEAFASVAEAADALMRSEYVSDAARQVLKENCRPTCWHIWIPKKAVKLRLTACSIVMALAAYCSVIPVKPLAAFLSAAVCRLHCRHRKMPRPLNCA